MLTFDTATLNDHTMKQLSFDEASWIYNGLDCCVTFEIFDELSSQLSSEPSNVLDTYQFALDKQAPVMEMSMRGLRVDETSRQLALRDFKVLQASLMEKWDMLCEGVFGFKINHNSPPQLQHLFYKALGNKVVRKRNARGQMTPTVNRDALEKFRASFYSQIFANFVLALRDVGKKITFLSTAIDDDGRLRCSFNIAGTNTGRLASSMSDFGTGTNLQNVDTKLRFPFVADPKKILVNVDLEQADARNVGAIMHEVFHDELGYAEAGKYLDACESGDLHTQVCKMAWRSLPWHDDVKLNRPIADQIFYRDMSYRDMAKRLGHGTNFLGKPHTMAMHTKTERSVIENFQTRYFEAFPSIPMWHDWTLEQISTLGYLTTLYGRRRYFFGRAKDPATHREAIAYSPQSMTAWQIDYGYLQLWKHMPEAELLVQVHDSIQFQVELRNLDRLMPKAMKLLECPLELSNGREFIVPLEAKVGWNWGDVAYGKNKQPIDNLKGLQVWKGSEQRQPPVYKKGRSLKDIL